MAGLGLLADKLYKPSRSNDAVDDFKIPEKCPRQTVQASSVTTVAMPTAALMPFAAESQFAVSTAATSQAALISQLSAADWQTLVEAGSTSTMLDPSVRTPSTALGPVTFVGTNARPSTARPAKKIILLVAKKPLTSINQSPTVDNINTSAATVTSSQFLPVPTNFLASSTADANSVSLPRQELVTSCTAVSSGQFGSSDQLLFLDAHSGSSEGHVGSSECHLGASPDYLVSSGHLASSDNQMKSSESQFGSPLHDSNPSSVEHKSSMILRCESVEAKGQEMLDEVETSSVANVDHHSVVTQLKQLLGVSDLYACS